MENNVKNIDDLFKEQASKSPDDESNIEEDWNGMKVLLMPAVAAIGSKSIIGKNILSYISAIGIGIIGLAVFFALKKNNSIKKPPEFDKKEAVIGNDTISKERDTALTIISLKDTTPVKHKQLPSSPKNDTIFLKHKTIPVIQNTDTTLIKHKRIPIIQSNDTLLKKHKHLPVNQNDTAILRKSGSRLQKEVVTAVLRNKIYSLSTPPSSLTFNSCSKLYFNT